MAVNKQVSIILLGGGYTLQRVAARLPRGTFVITSRREEQCAAWRSNAGWDAEVASVDSADSLRALFSRYPDAKVLVDSVPPLRSGNAAAGVENVVRALPGTQIRKIIYLSTTGVFGARDGRVVDEATPPAPWNEQGRARLESEIAYRAATKMGLSVSSTSLRLPAIYGEDRGLLQSLKSGSYRMVDAGSLWTNRIHVEDLANIIVKAIGAIELPEVLCVSDDEPAQAKDVVSFVCRAHALPLPSSITSGECVAHGAYTMVSNQRVNNNLMKKILGISLTYPSYREGMGVKR